MPCFKFRKAWAFLGVALLATPFSWSQSLSSRVAVCGACHGPQGNSVVQDIPSLAGQPKVFLENQLVLIREGMRDIPQMKGVLDNVADAELAALIKNGDFDGELSRVLDVLTPSIRSKVAVANPKYLAD